MHSCVTDMVGELVEAWEHSATVLRCHCKLSRVEYYGFLELPVPNEIHVILPQRHDLVWGAMRSHVYCNRKWKLQITGANLEHLDRSGHFLDEWSSEIFPSGHFFVWCNFWPLLIIDHWSFPWPEVICFYHDFFGMGEQWGKINVQITLGKIDLEFCSAWSLRKGTVLEWVVSIPGLFDIETVKSYEHFNSNFQFSWTICRSNSLKRWVIVVSGQCRDKKEMFLLMLMFAI